jgi:hypothetical protein
MNCKTPSVEDIEEGPAVLAPLIVLVSFKRTDWKLHPNLENKEFLIHN